jgi:type I restriction enzyme S subunit
MSRYKRYERYKDSGVEWIGEIPEHWGVKPLKRVFKIINGGTPSSSEESYWNGEIVWVTPNDLSKLTEACIVDSERKITQDGLHNCSARIVPKGSIVISTRAPIGYVAIAGVPLCTNQGCKSLVAINKVNPKYFYYWMHSISFYLNVLGQGTTFIELSNSSLSMVELLTPSINEQKAIANFLDQKTAVIDDLIADKEKLIELLQEKRQAIITEAVTKGLNPNVRMKDSGIEWIGEIPEHWNNKKISWIFNIIGSGTTPSTSNLEYYDGDVPWVNTGDLNDGYLYETSKMITDLALKDYSTLKFYPIDTLLIAMYGATIGKLSITKIIATTNQACCALAQPKNVNIKFIFYWFLANRNHIIAMAYGGGQPNISQNLIKSLRINLPEKHEQNAIVNFLDQKTAEIDSLVTETKNQIEKLKEYRQSLISEAVTGKIDVREFQKKNEVIFRNE